MSTCLILDHWCTPPPEVEPATLNMTLDQWKMTFLPMELGPDYKPRSSQCMMYAINENQTLNQFVTHQLPGNRTDLQTVSCEQLWGYEYDQRFATSLKHNVRTLSIAIFSDMYNTAVTDNDWVCSKMKRATDLFTLGVVGLIVGTFIFSLIADFKGRKISFFLSTFFMIILCIIPIWVSHSYPWYLALKVRT